MRLRVASLLAVGLIAGSALPLWLKAQTTTSGGLSGVVTDPSNAVVPDASVVITDSTKGTVHAVKTNRDGAYSFSFLAPGKYTLQVSHEGFRERS